MCVGLNSLHKYLYPGLSVSTAPNPQGYGHNTNPITLSQYLYANANPVNESDPTGHIGLDDEEEAEYDDTVLNAGTNAVDGVLADAAIEQLTEEAVETAVGQAAAGNGFAVIGSYPGYIQTAQTLGAAFFQLSDALYAAAGQVANTAFVQAAIALGTTFILSTPPEEAGPGLQLEIQLLLQAGYQYAQTGLGITLTPPGGG